jgi:DNA polymerase III alpha subunit
MNVFAGIPGREEIVERYRRNLHAKTLNVNSHVHTPYSFSAFDNMEELFDKARQEGINVLGINDFNGADGFDEFYGWQRNIPFSRSLTLNLSDCSKGTKTEYPHQ